MSPYALTPMSTPPMAMPPALPQPALTRIGDIEITQTTVRTPYAEFPLRGSNWIVTDQWMAAQKTPTWAIVLAIVGFCILTFFSLLFLLAKETVYRGVVMVTVTNGRFQYSTSIPVVNAATAHYIRSQVNYARALSAM
ncbi:MAG: hypothetical protein JXA67_02140 [Micromonosporaceae bacterium]|nr:hypothetical protein [Micromonosporaceae bacterium]